jgi:hypothetical protein
MYEPDKTLDAQARRAAKRAGYIAKRSRWRRDSIDNHGGFMLIDAHTNDVGRGSASPSPSGRP